MRRFFGFIGLAIGLILLGAAGANAIEPTQKPNAATAPRKASGPATTARGVPAPDQWREVIENGGRAFYFVRPTDWVRNADGVRVWIMEVPRDPKDGVIYSLDRWWYDCSAMTHSVLAGVEYDARGNTVGSYSVPSKPRSIVPGSIGEVLAKAMCRPNWPAYDLVPAGQAPHEYAAYVYSLIEEPQAPAASEAPLAAPRQ